MTVDHRALLEGFSRVLDRNDWDRLSEYVADDAVWEYPQSGERFVGLENIRAQFANYPDMEPGTSELNEVIGETQYVLTPNYTLIAVDGSGDRGIAIVRVRYPDGSRWWAVNLYEVRGAKIGRSRSFFAPELDAPDWRAPYREPVSGNRTDRSS